MDAGGTLLWADVPTPTHGLLIRSVRLDQLTVGTGTSSNGFQSLIKLAATNRVRWAKSTLLRAGSGQASGAMLALDAASSSLYLAAYSTGEAIAFDGPGSPLVVAANTYTTCVARCETAGVVQWVKPPA